MRKNQIIFAILLFALVPARAKIFAQVGKGTSDSIIRKSQIEQEILTQGIDSILTAAKYTRDNIEVMIDTLGVSSLHGARGNGGKGSYIGKLLIKHIQSSHKILSSTKGIEDGIVIVSADGTLCCLPFNKQDETFSFTRTSKYRATFDYVGQMSGDSSSFWDSTAKPILVTLGAVAVIALFFLIRG